VADASITNAAQEAAEKALAKLYACLEERKSFVFEAGAGAGKTHSLVKGLEFLLRRDGYELLRLGRRIACITYTNVASDEITERTGRHPAVASSTIHAFCWSILRDFQAPVRAALKSDEKWVKRVEESGGQWEFPVEYELGYPAVRDGRIFLGHTDVIPIMIRLMSSGKFRRLLTARFPVIFVDEYQDTDSGFVDAIKRYFLETNEGPLIGFFGDRWQKIYGEGCGEIEHATLETIAKGANFRSSVAVVQMLNEMRPELPQAPSDPRNLGSVMFFHANGYLGARREDGHSKGDLPTEAVTRYLDSLRNRLAHEGWDFTEGKVKILMLTHRGLAAEQGYYRLIDAFGRNESWTKKEDALVNFFADTFEPAFKAFKEKRYGEMFSILERRAPTIRKAEDKQRWADSFNHLAQLRETGTIGQVLAHLHKAKIPRLPEAIQGMWDDWLKSPEEPVQGEALRMATLRKLVDIPYQEMRALVQFINDYTPFATQHGVKGAEFDDVIVVLGRGWNHYDFNAMLEWWYAGAPKGRQEMFERSRNLFYVACSRPRKRLAVLFTQELSEPAQQTVVRWLGHGGVEGLNPN